MPDVENNKQDLVDIDTSGPGADVELEETKVTEAPIDEVIVEEIKEEPKAPAEDKSFENERAVKLEKKTEEPKEELEEYSEGVKKRISKLEPGYVNAMEGKLKNGIESAKAQLLRAREAGDIDAEVNAQKEIARIGVEESKVNTLKNRYQQAAQTPVAPRSLDQAVQAPPADPKAEAWADNNDWFGKDNAMTYTAFDLHEKLTKQEGFDPHSDDYYTEIDRRMRLDFPHRFGNTETRESTKPTQTVASATRSVKPGRQTVRLTSSQVAIAKKLGVPLEEYAKQLKITKEA